MALLALSYFLNLGYPLESTRLKYIDGVCDQDIKNKTKSWTSDGSESVQGRDISIAIALQIA